MVGEEGIYVVELGTEPEKVILDHPLPSKYTPKTVLYLDIHKLICVCMYQAESHHSILLLMHPVTGIIQFKQPINDQVIVCSCIWATSENNQYICVGTLSKKGDSGCIYIYRAKPNVILFD